MYTSFFQYMTAPKVVNLFGVHLLIYYHVMAIGAGAVDYIIKHAEIDLIFVQDKKIKEVRI